MSLIQAVALLVLQQIAGWPPASGSGTSLRPLRATAEPDGPSSRGMPTPPTEASQQQQESAGWTFRWLPGPSLRLRDAVRLDLHARVQMDVIDSPLRTDAEGASGVDIARRRVGVEGELAGVLQFEIERELDSADPWRDVYVNYRQFESLRIQAGHFKLPFSLEENVGATNLDFIHRSRAATHLAPGRDRGVVIHGRPFTRRFRYEAGIFAHDGRNARTGNPERVFGGTTRVGRLTLQPFAGRKSELADLRMGMAFTTSTLPEGFPALRGRTVADASFFKADVWVNGRRRRTGLELRWRPGPLSIQTEYIRVEDERRGESVEDTDLSPLVATGWYVSGTWAITGERKAAGLDRPRRPFLSKGGIGAIELAARLEMLGFRSAADDEPPATSPRANVIVGNALHASTFGVNWYPNRWIKVQANIIRERMDDPSQGELPVSTVFWNRALRLQLAF